ncbi:MAG: NTP transferase domain-containing protein [Oscillospiraceae bacterium]|jgi:UDP-N-acetylglucosamine diphosphorylase/glucosamine-1-phosphate N-acetyltransferase|nr:NTP transferase domain-containing protein [Oscillospiraceae bacterium]
MKAIILAAGKGKRLLSEQFNAPKVLRKANGKPLLRYVVENLSFIDKKDIVIVAGYKKEMVFEEFPDGFTFAVQDEQKGTGHAANCAKEALGDYDGPVLICFGDMPMFKKSTYENLAKLHVEAGNDCTILTGVTDRKLAYGRIVRDAEGNFVRVVEDRDCTPEQKAINELNVGICVFDAKKLFPCLSELKSNNAQGEYYLTDVPSIMLSKGYKVGTFTIHDDNEVLGVNTPEELALCESILK